MSEVNKAGFFSEFSACFKCLLNPCYHMSTHRSMGDIVGRDPRDVGLSPSLRGGGGGPMGGGGPPKGGPGGGGPLRGGPFIIPIKQEKELFNT